MTRPRPATPSHQPGQLPDVNAATIAICIELGHLNNYRKASSSLVQTTGDQRLYAVKKRLLDCDELRAVERAQERLLEAVYRIALPSYLKAGIHLVPIGLVRELDARLVEGRDQITALASTLAAALTTRINEMETRLGDGFDRSQYPTAAEVEAMFSVSWRYMNMTPDDRLQTISGEIFDREVGAISNAAQETAHEIRALLRSQALEVVAHLRDRLAAVTARSGRPAHVHPSAVAAVQDFLNLEPLRNVTNDRELGQALAQLRAGFVGDADRLNDDQTLRQSATALVSQIADRIDGLVQAAPRAIRLRDSRPGEAA